MGGLWDLSYVVVVVEWVTFQFCLEGKGNRYQKYCFIFTACMYFFFFFQKELHMFLFLNVNFII